MKYREVPMLNLKEEYDEVREEINLALSQVASSGQYIGGKVVRDFESQLEEYLDCSDVVSCGNGTDALQIALMSLDLDPGDEVVVPAFTYVAAIEVVCLLGLKPVLVDIDALTFGVTADHIRPYISERTKAIIVVHLFGQCIDMKDIMRLAEEHNLHIIEDNAQSFGSAYRSFDKWRLAGTIGHIGCMSFFPSKSLGAFGDAGAICTNDKGLAKSMSRIARHGQSKKYYHETLGVNSRLDAIQAKILTLKLALFNDKVDRRQVIAAHYDEAFVSYEHLMIPYRLDNSTHIYGQYTLRVKNDLRDQLMNYLQQQGISSVIYYPIPAHRQKAFQQYFTDGDTYENAELVCSQVLSIPIYPTMSQEDIDYVIQHVHLFFEKS